MASTDKLLDLEHQDVVSLKSEVERAIFSRHYDYRLYYDRGRLYDLLNYPDLAAGDFYKALLLIDEVLEDSGEYHEDAVEQSLESETLIVLLPTRLPAEALGARAVVLVNLAKSLRSVDCLRPAYEFAQLAMQTGIAPEAQEVIDSILQADTKTARREDGSINVDLLPDRGIARREVYPWNEFEETRQGHAVLERINKEILTFAPKLRVGHVELPVPSDPSKTSHQLGLFAHEDIAPGEQILKEPSVVTATSRVLEPLCDACCGTLDMEKSVACSDCYETAFCDQACLDLAQSYHPALCGHDVEDLSRHIPPAESADALYTLLLFRILAQAQCLDAHPLTLNRTELLWGDFSESPSLPFSFKYNILAPIHFLISIDVDIFRYDHFQQPWIWNTLLAKFRAVASARVGRDGRPEVAAVHPFWCLANHSCDPNVTWEWAAEATLTAKTERRAWKRPDGTTVAAQTAGIKAGEEILSHYVDIDLDAQARRDWADGALSGPCMCGRCKWELGESDNVP